MVKRFHGRVALVTGCASGIGRVTAQVFAREGARIVVSTDSNIQGGEETVRLISAAGGEATFIKCDVSKAVEVHLHPSGGRPASCRRLTGMAKSSGSTSCSLLPRYSITASLECPMGIR